VACCFEAMDRRVCDDAKGVHPQGLRALDPSMSRLTWALYAAFKFLDGGGARVRAFEVPD
jgi:hypothetical protein